MRIRFVAAALATAFTLPLLAACQRQSAETQPPDDPRAPASPALPPATSGMPAASAEGRRMMEQMRAGCPMVIKGADVSVADTKSGVALTFSTADGEVGELRTRARRMARMYEEHRGQQGTMMWHPMSPHGMRGMHDHGGTGGSSMAQRGPMPAAKAKVTNVDKGARVELEPTDPAKIDALRAHARLHQDRMRAGQCWMLQGQSPQARR